MREEEEKDRKQVFFKTVALGILSLAAAPRRATLLHVCMVAAGVCWCFIWGSLCFTLLAACYQACRALVLGIFIDTETLSLQWLTALLIPASNVDF